VGDLSLRSSSFISFMKRLRTASATGGKIGVPGLGGGRENSQSWPTPRRGLPCPLRGGYGDQPIGLRGPESMRNSILYSRGIGAGKARRRNYSRQKGFTITNITIPIIKTVGTSFHIRQARWDTVLASAANLRTEAEKNPCTPDMARTSASLA